MCLAIPMQIVRLLPDGTAVVKRDELEAEVDVSLLETSRVGDYVIVHAGYAIEVLDLEEARERLQLFDALTEAASEAGEQRP